MGVVHPPYHLRTNKAVDRLTLIRQLTSVLHADVGMKSSSATYHSLAGPFLEDLRLVHRSFPRLALCAIEADKQTSLRQEAHRFCSNLKFANKKVAEFISEDYESDAADIFWLDYTDMTLSVLTDFQALLRLLIPGSLVRLTVRAESPVSDRSIPDALDEDRKEAVRTEIQSAFVGEFDRFMPPKLKTAPLPAKHREYAKLVQHIIRMAISEVFDPGNDREFLHLETTSYSDGTPMLSVTGIVCGRRRIRSTASKLMKQGCGVDGKWAVIREIDLPYLSIQERLKINKSLPHVEDGPSAGEALYELLNYNVAVSKPKSVAALEQYAEYRHEYPSFVHYDP